MCLMLLFQVGKLGRLRLGRRICLKSPADYKRDCSVGENMAKCTVSAFLILGLIVLTSMKNITPSTFGHTTSISMVYAYYTPIRVEYTPYLWHASTRSSSPPLIGAGESAAYCLHNYARCVEAQLYSLCAWFRSGPVSLPCPIPVFFFKICLGRHVCSRVAMWLSARVFLQTKCS